MKKYYTVFNLYKELFFKMYGQKPAINYAQCSKLMKELMDENGYSEEMLCNIVQMYFENEKPDKVFHLPWILSAASINKYIGVLNKKVDSNIFNNADEFNEN